MRRLPATDLRQGDVFALEGAKLRADNVGPRCVIATVLEGDYRGSLTVAYVPTQSVWVEVEQ